MSTSRRPAGTSVGGQWAPGASGEVADFLDFEDAFDDEMGFVEPEPESEPVYGVAPDGGFDFGIAPQAPETSNTLIIEGRERVVEPGEFARIVPKKSSERDDSFVLAGTRGMVYLTREPNPHYDPDEPGSLEPKTEDVVYVLTAEDGPANPRKGTGQSRYLLDTASAERFSATSLYPVNDYGVGTDDGEVLRYEDSESVRAYLTSRAPFEIGPVDGKSERQHMEETGAGPASLSDSIEQQKAYDFMAENPSLVPRPPVGSDDFDIFESTTTSLVEPEHRDTIFADRTQGADYEVFYTHGGEVRSVRR